VPLDNTPIGTATVAGGGPAGLMAAEVLATNGFAVTVFEHMPSVGRKFLLAGRGGLNITHSEPIEQMITRYGPAAERLASSIRSFGPTELRAWCAGLGQPTFVGTSGRVFPQAFRATPLLRAWLARLASLGVTIETRHRWLGFDGPSGSQFRHADGTVITVESDVTVLALGGASWPRVGSDGGWVDCIREIGVVVNDLRPANGGVRVDWSSDFAGRFEGVPLKNVAVTVAGESVRGDAMITRVGLEGGPVYAHSVAIRDALDADDRCLITVDLHPDLTALQLRDRLTRRRPKESMTTLLRRVGLTPVSIALLREATQNQLPASVVELATLIKSVPVAVVATMPIARAISSAGGVALNEVDQSFMLLRRPGTFVVGEMLDWEAPTGGYLLQASFSTAVAAAHGARLTLIR
jgi:uncharacterized flavoprotein (TIGR03862 family)